MGGIKPVAFLKSIVFAGIFIVLAVVGIYMMAVSKQQWEDLLGKCVSIRDLEISKTSMVVVRVIGAFFLIVGFSGTYYLFMG